MRGHESVIGVHVTWCCWYGVCKIVYWLGVLKCVAAAADPGSMIHAGLLSIVDLLVSRFEFSFGRGSSTSSFHYT